jgi:hypothetical protein
MKAVVVSEFGAPSVLKLADMPKPQLDRDQVLVASRQPALVRGTLGSAKVRVPFRNRCRSSQGPTYPESSKPRDRLSVVFTPATKSTASPTSDSPTATPNMLWPKQG